jgi:hypothetical protein
MMVNRDEADNLVLMNENNSLERGINENQREIRRLRGIALEYSQFRSGVRFMQVEVDILVSGRMIGDIMDEAWSRALDMDARELSFIFNGRRISIRKEESCLQEEHTG